jgi:hypothetical protein
MSFISTRRAVVALAVFAMLMVAAQANAACCGGGMTTAFYPSTHSAYYAGSYSASYPMTYQTNYSGWYPGYYWDRIRTRLWGSPSTYVAAYPTMAYSASYAPTYTASYAPTYATTSYSPTYATSYAAPACSSCATCQSCTVGYAPSTCATCAPSCPTCPTCAVPSGVTQTSYQQQQPPCNCGNGQTQMQQSTGSAERAPDEATTRTYSTDSGNAGSTQPSVPEGTPAIERQEQKPPVNGTPETQPSPGDDSTEDPEVAPYLKGENSTYFEPPKLHDPNDRTAQRAIAPVKTALYKQLVAYRNVSTQRVTAEQARQDAIGWTSASN